MFFLCAGGNNAPPRDNTQMITYARWGYEVLGADSVEVAHVYGRTKAPARASPAR